MSHTTNVQQLLATGTRDELLAYCQWNDRNGIWADGDRAAEDYPPATINELRECIAAWEREARTTLTTTADGDPVWAYVIKDVEVYAPTVSECGRFAVDPLVTYGLTPDDVTYLANLNRQYGYNDQI